eukprot:SAG25_NODE_6496_length_555_cov_0.592105_1_plen_50_part_10
MREVATVPEDILAGAGQPAHGAFSQCISASCTSKGVGCSPWLGVETTATA